MVDVTSTTEEIIKALQLARSQAKDAETIYLMSAAIQRIESYRRLWNIAIDEMGDLHMELDTLKLRSQHQDDLL